MTLTALDPRTALVVVDLQEGVMGLTGSPFSTTEVLERSVLLADAFRAHDLPVVLVRVTGGAPGRTDRSGGPRREWPEGFDVLRPELTEGPHLVVTKRTWGAFTGTDLHQRLQELGVTQVVLTGVATSAGVESTARGAHEHGYHVSLVVDAMTDTDASVHENSTTKVFPKIGETGTTAQLLALLG